MKLKGTLVNLALHAGYMIASGEITVEDSSELISSIVQWADEFEQSDSKSWPDEDYLLSVDAFAEKKLLEAYGSHLAG